MISQQAVHQLAGRLRFAFPAFTEFCAGADRGSLDRVGLEVIPRCFLEVILGAFHLFHFEKVVVQIFLRHPALQQIALMLQPGNLTAGGLQISTQLLQFLVTAVGFRSRLFRGLLFDSFVFIRQLASFLLPS